MRKEFEDACSWEQSRKRGEKGRGLCKLAFWYRWVAALIAWGSMVRPDSLGSQVKIRLVALVLRCPTATSPFPYFNCFCLATYAICCPTAASPFPHFIYFCLAMYAIRCPTATSPFPYFILKVLSPLAYNVFLVAPRVHFVDTSNGDAPLDAIIVAFLIIATSGVLQSILWRTMSTFVLVEYVCREEETEQPNREWAHSPINQGDLLLCSVTVPARTTHGP